MTRSSDMTIRRRERGAAMVEMAIVLPLFLLLLLAVFEFALMILDWSRTVEMTRDGLRTAIVNAPPCDVYGSDGGSCPGDVPNLACPGGAAVSFLLSDVMPGSCVAGDERTACILIDRMRAAQPRVEAGNVRITYACSGAGNSERPEPIPAVSVSVEGMRYHMVVPGVFGWDAQIPMPSFETSHSGEDLD